MTIIYDMANGTIQSETTPESGNREELPLSAPAAELHLAAVEPSHVHPGHDNQQAAVHLIRQLLSSD
jgi:hypothetical protein